jgi:hypothetical protein
VVSPSDAIVLVRGKVRTVGDAVIRGRALVAALDETLSTSAQVHRDPRSLALRADLDVARALNEFERELPALELRAREARESWAQAARETEAWKGRVLVSTEEDQALLAQQAFMRQQEQALLASELRLELEEWEQMAADYQAVIEILRGRLPA